MKSLNGKSKARVLSLGSGRRAFSRAQLVLTKGSFGRRGLPPELKAAMLADYYQLRSIAKVAEIYGRTRQCIWEILATAGCKFFKKNPLQFQMYRARKFTPGKNGYLRDTSIRTPGLRGIEAQLNRQVWVDHNGPIPAGFQVAFLDGDKSNCTIENLICLSQADIGRMKSTGENQHTKAAPDALFSALQKFNRKAVP